MRRAFLTMSAALVAMACQPPPTPAGDGAKADTNGDPKKDGQAGGETGGEDIGEAPIDTASSDPRKNPMAKPDFGKAAPPTWDPGPPEGTGATLAAGWSKDGGDFGWCATANNGCTVCEFLAMDRSAEELSDCAEGSDKPDPELAKVIHDRLAKNEYGDPGADWFFADRLNLVWAVSDGDRVTMQPSRLRIGAQVRDSQVPVFSMIINQPDYERMEPAYIGLSPDGKFMGAVGRSPGPEGSEDAYKIQIVPVHELANKAFNGAAMVRHRGEDYEGAIELYHLAATVQPTDANAMYNLACALARTDAPATRAALEEAVNRGQKYVRKKMATDSDLDAVRDEAWFKALAKGD